ncbi:MAG: ATP-binding protein [Candidatus Hodarchaeales archaeon]
MIKDSSQSSFQTIKAIEKKLVEVEESLRKSNAINLSLSEYAPVGIMYLDNVGRINFANPAATGLLSYFKGKVKPLEGERVLKLPYFKNQHDFFEGIKRLLQGEPLIGCEFELSAITGNKYIRTYGSPIFDEKGTMFGAVLMLTDISDLRTSQTRLKQDKEELSDFIHAMAHDLRSDLSNIIGYASCLEKLYDPKFVNQIIKSSNNINNLLVKSVSLIDAGLVIEKTDNISLDEIVETAYSLIIPKSVTFIRDSLPTVTCDRYKLFQVFKNLFENAISHANPKMIEIKAQKSVRGTYINVSNDGGVFKGDIERIFERGYTTRKGSSGLGLSIIKKVIDAHGWQISLETHPKTTFKIHIPRKDIVH